MNKSWCALIVPGILALVGLALVVMLLVVKLLWAWTIPDLFPGAVQQGLIARTISWWTAFKVAIFVAVMAGLAGGARKHKES
jgi:hypothetical protein